MLSFSLLLVAGLVTGPTDDGGKTDDIRPKAKIEVPAEVGDLTGYYTVSGQEPGGKRYSGLALIVKKNDAHLVTWTMVGGSSVRGVGVRVGDKLSVGWMMQTEKGIVQGTNLYTVSSRKGQPYLSGTWLSVPGPGIANRESLSFLKTADEDE